MKKVSFKIVKTLIASAILLLIGTNAYSQKSKKKISPSQTAFHKGSNTLGLGLGAGVGYNYYGDITSLPAFFVSFDHGIIDNAGPGNIGIGGIVAMKYASYKYTSGGYKAVWRNYIVGARGTWHLTLLADKNNKFDPYGGVTLGLRFTSHDDTYYNLNPTFYPPYAYKSVYPIAGAFVGAKYNFAKAVGVFAELGYDISFFRAGLNFNF